MKTRKKISIEEALEIFEGDFTPDPALVRDATDYHRIIAAREARDETQERLDQAVIDARKNGATWMEIGLALGVSHQAARKKYIGRVS